jgi:hypothetical protein
MWRVIGWQVRSRRDRSIALSAGILIARFPAKWEDPSMRVTACLPGLLSVIGLTVIGTGCRSPTPFQPIHVELVAGEGTVVGGIAPCFGIPPSPGGPTYVAGTVTVFRGQVRWKPDGPGSFLAVLPTARVAEQSVATNATYRFVLDAGSYVLQAHFAGARFASPNAVVPFIGVTVSAGRVTAQSIPNECK